MNTGPLTSAFDEDNEGVVLKEFIVYRVIDGNLTREKFVRNKSEDKSKYATVKKKAKASSSSLIIAQLLRPRTVNNKTYVSV